MALADNTYDTARDIIESKGFDLGEIVVYLARFTGKDEIGIEDRIWNAISDEVDAILYESATE